MLIVKSAEGARNCKGKYVWSFSFASFASFAVKWPFSFPSVFSVSSVVNP